MSRESVRAAYTAWRKARNKRGYGDEPNAAKYGALSASEGQLEVKWSHTAWTETGGPPVKVPTRHGFGGKVIKSMIEQLKGQTRFDWRPEGLICEITLQA
jgi:two-component sensor histidine kinase